MPTLWFTLSAADNHWIDLFKTLHGTVPHFENPQDFVKWKRKQVRDNPHFVDSYFYDRVKVALESFFGSKGLDMKWFWFRVEFQKRGTAHIHGCLRLKSDPDIALLGTQVLKGRTSSKIVKMYNSNRDDEFVEELKLTPDFEESSTEFDVFKSLNFLFP